MHAREPRPGDLLAAWGSDVGRTALAHARPVLGSDAEVLYVLGERGGDLTLETWGAHDGALLSTKLVTGGAAVASYRA